MSARGRVSNCSSISARMASIIRSLSTDEDHLGVGVVLGLAEQVGGGEHGIGAAVGDDQQFGRAGGHVDGGTAGQGGGLFLGLGHPGVAGAEQLVAGSMTPSSSSAPKVRAAMAWAPPISQSASRPASAAA
jgi:hypothetical protein